MKTCSQCGKRRHESHYYFSKPGYRRAQCKECYRSGNNRREKLRRLNNRRSLDAMRAELAGAIYPRGVLTLDHLQLIRSAQTLEDLVPLFV